MKWFDYSYSKQRIFGLDIMRAYAILSVLYLHAYTIMRGHFGINKSVLKLNLIDGVSVFFVLSGFLIGGIILDIAQRDKWNTFGDILNFWKQRWLRTIPAYIFVLLINIYFSYSIYHYLPDNIYAYFLFLQTFYFKVKHYFFFESWSLCVEEWFYFFIPIFFVLFHYISKNVQLSLVFSALLLIVYSTFFRYYFFVNNYAFNDSINFYRFATVNRFDSIAFGILGVLIFRYYPVFWIKSKYIALSIGIFLIVWNKFYAENYNSFDLYNTVFIYTIEPLSALMFIPFLHDIKKGINPFLTSIITRISLISYSLYLLNAYTIKESLIKIILTKANFELSSDNLALLTLYLFYVLSFLLAHLLYAWVEKPFMEMRK